MDAAGLRLGSDFVARCLTGIIVRSCSISSVVRGRFVRVPLLGEICPCIVLGFVFSSIRSIRNTVEKIVQIYLMRTFQRTSFFKPTVPTLFHDRTS
jgi:hypothetical protein